MDGLLPVVYRGVGVGGFVAGRSHHFARHSPVSTPFPRTTDKAKAAMNLESRTKKFDLLQSQLAGERQGARKRVNVGCVSSILFRSNRKLHHDLVIHHTQPTTNVAHHYHHRSLSQNIDLSISASQHTNIIILKLESDSPLSSCLHRGQKHQLSSNATEESRATIFLM